MARYQIPLFTQLFRSFFTRAVTVDFPFGPAEIPPGFRGRVDIIAENCTGCSLCVRDCPALALELNREDKQTFQLIHHHDRCAYCGQCELSCNFDAIHLHSAYVQATQDRDSLALTLVDRKKGEE